MVNFKQIVENNKELIIKKTQELIQIPSVLDESSSSEDAPFGIKIKEALDYMMNLAKEDGFETALDGGYAGHVNYGNKNGKIIGVLCHLDVVPEGTDWLYPPYAASIVDGKMYGRGTTDDKGPTMAAYFALKFIKDAGIKIKNQIRIIFGTDEETGWRGIAHYLQNFPMPDMGFAPDASFPLIYGEKGRMSYDLTLNSWDDEDILVSITGGERYNVVLEEVKAIVKKDLTKEFETYAKDNNLEYNVEVIDNLYHLTLKGKAAHAMEPHKGVNAGTHMCNFLKDYSNNQMVKYVADKHHLSHVCEKLGLDYEDYEMGPITCNIGIMNINKEATRVTLDLRYPVRYDTDNFNKKLEEITSKFNISITDKTNKTPHYVSPEDDLVKLLYQAYVKNTNDSVNKPFTIGGGTYASILERAVAFGMMMPDEEELCHQRNEYLNLDTLFKGILIYIDAMLALGEVDA
ncbi:MAG: dipeptidase PepV [Bacilli bacterium]|nr:dipeptidase PepV [Bacilli bacterium]